VAMDFLGEKWTQKDKQIARNCMEAAYERQSQAIIARLREMVHPSSAFGLREIHDYLRQELRQMDKVYEFRTSTLFLSLPSLLAQGWLHRADLEGLDAAKLEKIYAAAEYFREKMSS
jgi:hypothetical protein